MCVRSISALLAPPSHALGSPRCAQDGTTPLFIAAQKGHTECMRLLIGAGADKDLAADVRPALSPRPWPRPLTRRALPDARRTVAPRCSSQPTMAAPSACACCSMPAPTRPSRPSGGSRSTGCALMLMRTRRTVPRSSRCSVEASSS